MAYSKFQLRCIELGLCVRCGDLAMEKGRRCASCAAKLAEYERKRYAKVAPRRRERRLLAAGRLSYVTLKRRERF